MFDQRHPLGWLFYWVIAVMALTGMAAAQSPTTSTISDVVYRADGTLAGGTLLISWPAFSTVADYSVTGLVSLTMTC
jgi:trimeric autotransporter adhesin